MFEIFKRTKIKNWEIELLSKTLIQLPGKYANLIDQIEGGLLKGVLTNASDIPGYNAFTYNPILVKKFEKPYESAYKLSGIKVYDKKNKILLSYEIYISSGTVSGYSLTGGKASDIDFTSIDISNFKRVVSGVVDYQKIANLFTNEEQKHLNPSDVYSIFIENFEYFHLKDIEDGNFIAIDKNNVVYVITHDPMEAQIIDRRKLTEFLKNGY